MNRFLWRIKANKKNILLVVKIGMLLCQPLNTWASDQLLCKQQSDTATLCPCHSNAISQGLIESVYDSCGSDALKLKTIANLREYRNQVCIRLQQKYNIAFASVRIFENTRGAALEASIRRSIAATTNESRPFRFSDQPYFEQYKTLAANGKDLVDDHRLELMRRTTDLRMIQASTQKRIERIKSDIAIMNRSSHSACRARNLVNRVRVLGAELQHLQVISHELVENYYEPKARDQQVTAQALTQARAQISAANQNMESLGSSRHTMPNIATKSAPVFANQSANNDSGYLIVPARHDFVYPGDGDDSLFEGPLSLDSENHLTRKDGSFEMRIEVKSDFNFNDDGYAFDRLYDNPDSGRIRNSDEVIEDKRKIFGDFTELYDNRKSGIIDISEYEIEADYGQ